MNDKIAPSSGALSERDAALSLHMVPGVGPKIFADLVARFGSAALGA